MMETEKNYSKVPAIYGKVRSRLNAEHLIKALKEDFKALKAHVK